MFEIGCDQAQGLRQLFAVVPRAQIHVLDIATSFGRENWLSALQRCFDAQGLRSTVADDDNHRLSSQTEEPVLLTSSGKGQPLVPHASRRRGALCFAKARPEGLTELYGGIKTLERNLGQEVLTVVWETDASSRPETIALCENNLQRTVQRFLGRAVQFHSLPVSPFSNAPANETIRGLSSLVSDCARQLGLQARPAPRIIN